MTDEHYHHMKIEKLASLLKKVDDVANAITFGKAKIPLRWLSGGIIGAYYHYLMHISTEIKHDQRFSNVQK